MGHCAKLIEFEHIADQLSRQSADYDLIRQRLGLQSRREVGRLAADCRLPRAAALQITHHNRTGSDPDTGKDRGPVVASLGQGTYGG